MDSPELTRVIDRILAACAAAKKPAGTMALSTEAAQALAARGVQALVHGVESHRLKEAMADIVKPLRSLRLPSSAP
jgi:2-keto-3-deoxy-L-rhamnonate aldolase RhmA